MEKFIKKVSKKCLLLLMILLVIFAAVTPKVLAVIVAGADPVENTFGPSSVSCKEITLADGIGFENTGNTDAFIRANVTLNWVNDKGEVYGTPPEHYTMTLNNSEWKKGSDGYYYYLSSVMAGNNTKPLILGVEALGNEDDAPQGYQLEVVLTGSAIQALGVDESGKRPVMIYWGKDAYGSVISATENSITVE